MSTAVRNSGLDAKRNSAGCGDAHSMLCTLACIKSAFKKRHISDPPPGLRQKSIMEPVRISLKARVHTFWRRTDKH